MSNPEKNTGFWAALQGATMTPNEMRRFLVATGNSLLAANPDEKPRDDVDFYADVYMGRLFDAVDEAERTALEPVVNPSYIPAGGLMYNARSGMRWSYGDPELQDTPSVCAPKDVYVAYLAMEAVTRVQGHAAMVYEEMYPDATTPLMGE